MTKKLYDYQKRAIEELKVIFKDSKHAYLQMPTGTGKTFTALKFAEAIKSKNNVWLCGSKHIVDQAERAATEYDIEGNWQFKTWQWFRSLKHKEKVDLIVIDEVHFGGSLGVSEASSITRILNKYKPKKALFVSASPWFIHEKNLGETRYISKVSLREALQKKYINDVELNSYVIGIDASILEIEKKTKKKMEELQEYTLEKLKELVGEEVSVSVKAVVQRRITEMIEIYHENESRHQCIFFCPTVEEVKFAEEKLNEVCGNGTAASIYEGKNTAAHLISQFKEGKIKVLVACQMLNEGFDYPKLEVIFDCNFSNRNTRRTYQKIGRILRKVNGKPTGRYYYAKDCLNTTEHYPGKEDLSPIILREMAVVSDLSKILVSSSELTEIGGQVKPTRKSVGFNREVFTINLSAAFDLLQSQEGAYRISDFFVDGYKHAADLKKEALLNLAKTGAPKPPKKHHAKDWGSKLANALYEYTSPKRGDYDPDFTKEIKSLRPEWFLTESEKIRNVYRLILNYAKKKNAVRPGRRTHATLYGQLRGLVSGTKEEHAKIREELEKLHPEWFPMQIADKHKNRAS